MFPFFFYVVSFRQLRQRRLVSSCSERTLKSIDRSVLSAHNKQGTCTSCFTITFKETLPWEIILNVSLLSPCCSLPFRFLLWLYSKCCHLQKKLLSMYSHICSYLKPNRCSVRQILHSKTQKRSGLPSFCKIIIKQDKQVNV